MTDILAEQNFTCNDNALVINDLQERIQEFLRGRLTSPRNSVTLPNNRQTSTQLTGVDPGIFIGGGGGGGGGGSGSKL